jgi:hypothetical protein
MSRAEMNCGMGNKPSLPTPFVLLPVVGGVPTRESAAVEWCPQKTLER